MASKIEREASSVRDVQESVLGEVEEWRPIPGYEEWYEVSSLGRVRTVPRILVPWQIPNGANYLTLAISASGPVYGYRGKNGGQKVIVHRLVATAFLGPCPDGKEINHKDGNRAHNAVTNLEYMTRSENVKHSYRELGHKSSKGRIGNSHKLSKEQVEEMLKLITSGMRNIDIAQRFGVTSAAVCWHARKVSY